MKKIPPYNTLIPIEGFVNLSPEGEYSYLMKPVVFGRGLEESVAGTIERWAEQIEAEINHPRSMSSGRKPALLLPSHKPCSSVRSMWRKAKQYYLAGRNDMQYRYFRGCFAEFYTLGKHRGVYHHFGPVKMFAGRDIAGPMEEWEKAWAERLPYTSILSENDLGEAMRFIRGSIVEDEALGNEKALFWAVRYTSNRTEIYGTDSYTDARAKLDVFAETHRVTDGSQFGIIWEPPKPDDKELLECGKFSFVSRLC